METIVLTHTSQDGILTQATFLPEHGMNLISYKRGDIEIIDPSTKESFDQRSAGLGPLIGPHFHRRKLELIPKIDNQPEFPQSAYCKEHGISDEFSHGVARYVPWKYERFEGGFKAEISGKDVWHGVSLAAIEGQNFQMRMEVSLDQDGLKVILSVVSDTDSIVGLHYFYRLPDGKGVVKSHIKDEPIKIPLDTFLDKNFRPFPHPRYGHIVLETSEYVLKTNYACFSEENSWQLYHPEGASFVCIEPLSAQDPRHPNLSVSSLTIQLKIETF